MNRKYTSISAIPPQHIRRDVLFIFYQSEECRPQFRDLFAGGVIGQFAEVVDFVVHGAQVELGLLERVHIEVHHHLAQMVLCAKSAQCIGRTANDGHRLPLPFVFSFGTGTPVQRILEYRRIGAVVFWCGEQNGIRLLDGVMEFFYGLREVAFEVFVDQGELADIGYLHGNVCRSQLLEHFCQPGGIRFLSQAAGESDNIDGHVIQFFILIWSDKRQAIKVPELEGGYSRTENITAIFDLPVRRICRHHKKLIKT